MTTGQKVYRTSDIYLSSALKLLKFKIVNVENENGRGIFVFEDRSDREECVRKYFSGELQVSAREYAFEWKNLKRMIFEIRDLKKR